MLVVIVDDSGSMISSKKDVINIVNNIDVYDVYLAHTNGTYNKVLKSKFSEDFNPQGRGDFAIATTAIIETLANDGFTGTVIVLTDGFTSNIVKTPKQINLVYQLAKPGSPREFYEDL